MGTVFPHGFPRAAALSLSAGSTRAVTVLLGIPHFTDGQTVTSADFLNAVPGQPGRFDNTRGGGNPGTDFTAPRTFALTPPDTVTGARLETGVWSGDSSAAGSQAGTFTVDGASIAALADAVLRRGPEPMEPAPSPDRAV